MQTVPAILVLEDGRWFSGQSFGATGEAFGEAVFTTGMSGYQETLTDPSYDRQIVVATAPHIGNTGWNDEDDESSKIWVSGLVVRDLSPRPSSWRAKRSLQDEMASQLVVGISGVDTRAVTRHLRERGVMRIGISTIDLDPVSLAAKVRSIAPMKGADLAGEVSTTTPYVIAPQGKKLFTVAAIDLGIKAMTPQMMASRGMEVHVLPESATIEDIRAVEPDGVFFSNGPGDPGAAEHPTQVLKQVLADHLPYFGICFGHQIFGRALGFETYKLKYGHRGINQPVKDLGTGIVEITAHNHGFAVDAPLGEQIDTDFGQVHVSHIDLNDQVVEGLELWCDGHLAGFSVQYHPEAAAGPHDAAYLFDRFEQMMEANHA